jgi:hypothetical protein
MLSLPASDMALASKAGCASIAVSPPSSSDDEKLRFCKKKMSKET